MEDHKQAIINLLVEKMTSGVWDNDPLEARLFIYKVVKQIKEIDDCIRFFEIGLTP